MLSNYKLSQQLRLLSNIISHLLAENYFFLVISCIIHLLPLLGCLPRRILTIIPISIPGEVPVQAGHSHLLSVTRLHSRGVTTSRDISWYDSKKLIRMNGTT